MAHRNATRAWTTSHSPLQVEHPTSFLRRSSKNDTGVDDPDSKRKKIQHQDRSVDYPLSHNPLQMDPPLSSLWRTRERFRGNLGLPAQTIFPENLHGDGQCFAIL